MMTSLPGRITSVLLPCSLFLIVVVRGFSLESGDLLDPTETRYATIAQNMVQSGDWITARLPGEGGLRPYFSKPPLHFWLTALSYKAFGFDEWTSRLPSFLALVVIVACLLMLAFTFSSREVGFLSAIICSSSPLLFFLAGSSTVDVTFTATIISAITALSISSFGADDDHPRLAGYLFFLFSALSFLTKGPAGLVIIGFTLVSSVILTREWRIFSRLPWIGGLALFVLVALPWFALVEQSNPGALWYYFVHENFLRYLKNDFGTQYGSAHNRPLGSIWWMVCLAVLPWVLYSLFYLKTVKRAWGEVRREPVFLMLLCLGLCPLIFFTFARSVLPAYTLPSIPGLAYVLAAVLAHAKVHPELSSEASSRFSLPHRREHFFRIPVLGLGLSVIMIGGLLVVAPQLEIEKSSSELLEMVARETRGKKPIVATTSLRDLSPFWTGGAFENELVKELRIVFANEEDIRSGRFRHLIVRDKRLEEGLFKELERHYRKRKTVGKWHWYVREGERAELASS
ncbi:MAG: glycosyltransferase family 39 protein [Bdellovibrionales bacterium]|nr:glycosyltransferase family 39 protein [Bdellovibrionales bacterium]